MLTTVNRQFIYLPADFNVSSLFLSGSFSFLYPSPRDCSLMSSHSLSIALLLHMLDEILQFIQNMENVENGKVDDCHRHNFTLAVPFVFIVFWVDVFAVCILYLADDIYRGNLPMRKYENVGMVWKWWQNKWLVLKAANAKRVRTDEKKERREGGWYTEGSRSEKTGVTRFYIIIHMYKMNKVAFIAHSLCAVCFR